MLQIGGHYILSNLTASAPRLSTGCSLRFTGRGLSPRYITCTALAHPHGYGICFYDTAYTRLRILGKYGTLGAR